MLDVELRMEVVAHRIDFLDLGTGEVGEEIGKVISFHPSHQIRLEKGGGLSPSLLVRLPYDVPV